MIIYVELTHVVPIDVSGVYDEYLSRAEVAQTAHDDPDFAELIGNGPHDIHDLDWSVVTDLDYMEQLDDEHPLHVTEAKIKTRLP